jgi:breast cancer 2 susceptibility protein
VFCSEFDIAAFVVFVGEAYIAAHQKKQWVFVTDGSISESKSEKLNDSLLAICFCSPYIDDHSDAPINYNLAGSTVCNVPSKQSLIFGSGLIWYNLKRTIVT